ncbi:MAG: RNA polymerase sigma factor [Gemmataceae bacterium]
MSPNGFHTTRWSLIVAAGRATPESRAALSDLCRLYWYPVYAFVRRRGHDPATADDLTQAFFTRLLEKDDLAAVSPERGRFRAFLLAACRNFLANQHDAAVALKRGGGAVLALEDAEGRYVREPHHDDTAERLFERRWATELLGRVMRRLGGEYRASGNGELYDALKARLTGGGAGYAEVAAALGTTEGAVKAAAHRLRARYGGLLREEIAGTVASADEVEGEIRSLLAALA